MRPPILQWKISLGLIGVVLVAVTVGSVLHSSQASMARGVYTYGGWTSYTPLHGHVPANLPPRMRREMCASRKGETSKRQDPFQGAFERSMRHLCKRR